MKFTRISLIFSLFVSLLACGPSQKDLNNDKRAEVMAVHDEVMPKLGQLKSFEKRASQKAEELAMDSTNMDRVKQLELLAVELDQAYEDMFVWMRQYEIEDEGKTPEEVKRYLEEQMVLVTKVNKSIKDVLAKSDSLLVD
ncbi:hypothetical protein J0A68_09280 [Algoriphagus sp. H41]|uniref:Viral A-type inclusion protein n=1 Tax=Algoriphagus oliviformis TaxID=2811231 RepID=A0ABS3C1Z6_9BACT|nr:hypothetical protein [Algoriphagus oliviformis]MBN7811148.1 hypothetical protein [Algoriphagus oliviformis]